MNRIKKFYSSLDTFEKVWLIASTLILFGVELYFKDSVIGIIATLTGILNVVLVAKGSMINYAFGIVNTVLYTIISYKAGYGGDFVTFLFYYIPLQFVGIYAWKNHTQEDTNLEDVKRMNPVQLVGSVVILIVGTYITMLLLPLITDIFNMPINELPFVDAFTTFAGIFAGILMLKRYAEQWYIWVFVNIGSVIMWVTMLGKEETAVAMVVMWGAYLVNALYGAYNWRKMEVEQNEN
ncbi:nicotinamide riboside transporter PnuC [Mollicutes bacterium LVI A0078]|nr:nicotinamide riboside transporter PnuC [Mollicutes bacterium LVI A0075]WOO91037.1 nicotinamide riboside transporter PnuC [Mollicutes bacterium LVI A0078]